MIGRPAKHQFEPGLRFNRLTTVRATKRGPQTIWVCQCDCGTLKEIRPSKLVSNKTKSCGCFRREVVFKHGHARLAEHTIWRGMLRRCFNPAARAFENYGGRGITVCERWLKFENFLADMGPRPSADHSIDRYPDNDGHYEPANCRWATRSEQERNKSRSPSAAPSADGSAHMPSSASAQAGIAASPAIPAADSTVRRNGECGSSLGLSATDGLNSAAGAR